MNYLAHAYLSFNHPKILVGNMISDYVKGKQQFEFETDIQQGIQLHRAIDIFTDKHPATKKAIQILKPQVGLYAGAFIDIVFDYFLANDKTRFLNDEVLSEFVQKTYNQLDEHFEILPSNFQLMFNYMKTQNWLFNYKHQHGISMSFKGITKRANYINKEHQAFEIFVNNIDTFEVCYIEFIGDVEAYAKQIISDF